MPAIKYPALLLLLGSAVNISAQEVPGLVTHWKMDNSCALIDAVSMIPAHGVFVDVSPAPNKENAPNSAIAFSGNTSYIALGAVDKLKLSDDKSISFWINPDISGTNRTGSILRYGTGIDIRYIEENTAARLNVRFGNTSFLLIDLEPGQWQWVTITFKKDFTADQSKVVCYLNGVQVGESEQNKSVHDFSNAIALIGPASQSVLTNGFRGRLDDMRLYDRTLTPAEIVGLALPAKLEYFRGKRLNGTRELSWKTQLEENLSHFNVQISMDGSSFTTISRMAAGKFNYVVYDYSEMKTPFVWYRLEMVDVDGKTQLSNVIRIHSGNGPETGDLAPRLFPNPGSTYLYVTGIKETTILKITNDVGVVVKTMRMSPGLAIDISGLRAGLYFITFLDRNETISSKFIKR